MKKLYIKQFDEKDEEITGALLNLGMSRYVARILAYLRNVSEAKTVELEMGTGMRQPEVSIAMKELKEIDWIKEREEKKTGKGRPYKIYSLKTGFNEIISHLERQQRKAVNDMQLKIERLKKLEEY